MHKALLLAVAFTFAAGCSTSSGADTAATAPTTTIVAPDTVAPDTTPVVDTSPVVPDPTRPFDVFVPSSYTKGTAMPLVVLLHGYGATGPIQEAYFGVQALAESEGFLYVHPTGTTNSLGKAFWNATDACCGYQTTVDDVAYLTGILDSVSAQYDVDPKRIYFMGHSNGGFMSYRMACELSGRVAAIASLAGATFLDAAKCNPSEPV
ncbi:MAG: prolyl oligopeptidase family serine peptidase, partial [Actinobacteria bacterium]|nr:prolyl oligopeptidase family serine peptidase [Actinomycetota bacterium]